MSSSLSFGRQAAGVTSAQEFLTLEKAQQLSQRFEAIDNFVGRLLVRSLQGERVIELDRQHSSVKVLVPSDEDRALLDDLYGAEDQQARGAWFLPSSVSIHAGVLNLPAIAREYGTFGIGMAWDWTQRRDVATASSSDALFTWSVLSPLVDEIFLPLRLRGPLLGEKSRDEQLNAWKSIDALLHALGFSVGDELAVMRYGGGWVAQSVGERLVARDRLLGAFAEQVHPGMAMRYRAYRLMPLAAHYYEKANSAGQATRKQVISSTPLKSTLSAFLGGDWLALLDYFGERPHPREQIVTALPAPRLHVGGQQRARDVAKAQGVPEEEIAKIAGALFKATAGLSPIESRTSLLREYWEEIDHLHARQEQGMPSLWGLVEDFGRISFNEGAARFQRRSYLKLLSAPLLRSIQEFWGTIMLPRWPERLVTEPFPHALLSQTFGPALRFWHGVALAAWFVCEGPMARTDIPGMPRYYERQLADLAKAGTPVGSKLFDELMDVYQRLPAARPADERSSVGEAGDFSLTVTIATGSRRDGFEHLRDVITRHRRIWARRYLDDYFKARWEGELGQADRAFNQLIADRGRSPTPKQFGRTAELPANHWFGGNIARLYEALGEKAPLEPEYHPLIPKLVSDPDSFGEAVFRVLGGDTSHWSQPPSASEEYRLEHERQNAMRNLAGRSLSYLQLREALGRLPTLKDFGEGAVHWLTPLFLSDAENLWAWFVSAVDTASGQAP